MGGRALMWSGTFKMIRDAPLLGTGVGSWQWFYQRHKDPRIRSEPDYTHNDYLNLTSDYGLVGAGIMLVVFGCFFRHAWRVARAGQTSEQRAFAAGAMTSVIAILAHSWFDFNLHIPSNALLLAGILGFTAAIADPARRVPDKPAPPASRYILGAAMIGICVLGVRFFVPTLLAYHHTDLGNGAKIALNYTAAFAHYERASALDPTYPKPHIKVGEIHLSSANWRRAPAKANERREFAHKAVQAYERALALNPYQAFVLANKGRAHELAGEDELALQSYQRAIAIAPCNAYAHYLLGCYYREHGEEEKALEAFDKAARFFHYADETFSLNYFESFEQRGAAQPK
jgi:tetratricopeptide (TPR) repeat protein